MQNKIVRVHLVNDIEVTAMPIQVDEAMLCEVVIPKSSAVCGSEDTSVSYVQDYQQLQRAVRGGVELQ